MKPSASVLSVSLSMLHWTTAVAIRARALPSNRMPASAAVSCGTRGPLKSLSKVCRARLRVFSAVFTSRGTSLPALTACVSKKSAASFSSENQPPVKTGAASLAGFFSMATLRTSPRGSTIFSSPFSFPSNPPARQRARSSRSARSLSAASPLKGAGCSIQMPCIQTV